MGGSHRHKQQRGGKVNYTKSQKGPQTPGNHDGAEQTRTTPASDLAREPKSTIAGTGPAPPAPGPVWRLRAVESLLFRDGRPLSDNGGAAMSLALPLPTTLAGCVRTRLGDALGWDWGSDGPSQALATSVLGPIACLGPDVVFPAPLDAVVHDDDSPRVMVMRPVPHAECCDMPGGLSPLDVTEDMKAARGYRYWKWDDMVRWLGHRAGSFSAPAAVPGPAFDERVHVALRSDTGTADEGKLYTTSMVTYEAPCTSEEWSVLFLVDDAAWSALPAGFVTPGGERRLAVLEQAAKTDWPACPADLAEQIESSANIRMQLATPALFSGRWKPGWIGEDGCGTPPSCPGLTLRLVSAAVGRRAPVSGWDYTTNQPKAVRWMAPAGSVFFFEVVSAPSDWVNSAWLASACDDAQDRRDGFGLALWGIW